MQEDLDLAKITLDAFHSIVYLSFLVKDSGLRERLIARAKPLLDRPGRSEFERVKMLEQTVACLLDYLELLVYLKSAPLGGLLETQKQVLKLKLIIVSKEKNAHPKKVSKPEEVQIETEKGNDQILDEKIIELVKTRDGCNFKDISGELGGEYSKRTLIRYINKLLARGLIKKKLGLDTRFPSYTVE
ncbi:MAG: hypothetical protein A3I32_02475 [Candidatus Yanofskybacteria bacterium RIFCSPLOWO2_02_FULL_45_10]|uniref:Uncharacterized protein n=3 Tax=Patescibacteria group TaxID=1783273 RepID=A0A1F8G2F8_9BACT|nr:MAG: hypothetical protein UU67_C0019G0007 [Candidatus Daviesbacteria bacterium GW2011_GWB1_41_5]OGN19524.1 MAG: hypothetical protein A3F25_00270 [Candidatus Yanofskybacteria bacterium RIFCSPHIGHO2_12_FULL_45_19b]OGN32240.1 MAG: hypothetical protein A3I32_02475 [Candidatus Yanofskybacteria bacterium RIFCSPLOWO2_02_FULL_45_10]